MYWCDVLLVCVCVAAFDEVFRQHFCAGHQAGAPPAAVCQDDDERRGRGHRHAQVRPAYHVTVSTVAMRKLLVCFETRPGVSCVALSI